MRFFTPAIAIFILAIANSATAFVNPNPKTSENVNSIHTAEFQKCNSSAIYSFKYIEGFKTVVKNYSKPNAKPELKQYFKSFIDYVLIKANYCCTQTAPNMNAEDIKAVPDFQAVLFKEYDKLVSFLLENKVYAEKSKEIADWGYQFANDVKVKTAMISKCLNPNDKAFLDKLENVHSKLPVPPGFVLQETKISKGFN